MLAVFALQSDASAMADDWDAVEQAFVVRERHRVLRPNIAGMRRLVEKIKADGTLRDLQPSVSHASLVFRRTASRSVLLEWHDKDIYQVSLVGPRFELSDTKRVPEENVMDVLRQYLEKAANSVSSVE